jgi:drug/metabolite transporter (DMT)-like permease
LTALALALVLVSAVAHASWNLLAKRGSNQEVFIWCSQVAIGVLLLPLGAFLFWRFPVDGIGWLFVLGTVLLHIFYFLFLARGYANADLSVVYPIARGMGPTLAPLLGVLILGESVSPLAIVGIALVIVGIYIIYWWGSFGQIFSDPLKLLKETGTRYAVFTGLLIASYSIWDKVGVGHVTPFLYMYLMSVGTAIGMASYVFRTHGMLMVRAELRTNGLSVVAVGMLTFLAYGLVLTALTFSQVSYIAPSREIGVVVGVLLGTLVLKEPFGGGRLLGAALIAAGPIIITLAP